MSLNSTVSAERVTVGFFGRRNAGKSSLVNAVTGQELSVVSDVKGTTTDPVRKAMELLPLGPVVIIDTPGFDDEGELGNLRVKKTREILSSVNIAVLVVDSTVGLTDTERELIKLFEEKNTPYITAYNKCDIKALKTLPENSLAVSAVTRDGVDDLKEKIAVSLKGKENDRHIVSDLLSDGDTVVLVTPIDAAAPKGRLILPQQMTIRDILDRHCTAVICQDTELETTLKSLAEKPKLVITDSQAFARVSKTVPDDIMLTSFSILFARYKGDLVTTVRGAAALGKLKDGDRVLISEGCTHHRQCGDIGSVKMPRWIEKFSGAKPEFSFTSGGDFPENLSDYSLIVHCGGCMLNEKEMANRIAKATEVGVPIVNYGIAIAHMHGILKKSLAPFPNVLEILDS